MIKHLTGCLDQSITIVQLYIIKEIYMETYVAEREITIEDKSRAVTAITKEAPRKGMLAEFVKNAREAGAAELHIDTVKIGSADKAILINDGNGMDAETVHSMGAIFGSPKAKNGKTEANYNTGARIMAVHNNEKGLAFTSKHDGVIRNAILTIQDGKYKIAENDPKFMQDYGKKYGFKGDWTAVILMGNSMKQPTFTKPYGNMTRLAPFEEQLKLRFNDDGGVATYIKGKKVKFNEEILPKKQWLVQVSNNVKIRYQLTDDPTMALQTSRGERFAIEKGKGSSKFATSALTTLGTLGAYAVQNELAITVELGEKHNSGETNYRDALLHPVSQERLAIDNFLPDIERYLPKELREYIDAKEGKKKSRSVKNPVRDFLKSHMKAMGMTTKGMIKSADAQEEAVIDARVRRGLVKKQALTHRKREERKPTPAEQGDGLPTMEGVIATPETFTEDFNHRRDIGWVDGKRAYINGNHTFIKKMDEGKKASFAQYLADAYTTVVGYQLDENGTKGALLGLATTILAEGTFETRYKADQKKG